MSLREHPSESNGKIVMTAFIRTAEGLSVAAGRYAVVAQGWSSSVADPRADACDMNEICLPAGEGVRIGDFEGLDIAVLPFGPDGGGAAGRSLAVGPAGLVVFDSLVLVAVEHPQTRGYRYASHLDEIVVVEFAEGGAIVEEDGGYGLVGCTTTSGDPIRHLDRRSPGAFSIEGEFVDMADPVAADAFDYGSHAFNAALDEHGFLADLDVVRTKLRARADHDGVGLLNRLSGMNRHVVAYYAPVAE